jgi:hypothetical protein
LVEAKLVCVLPGKANAERSFLVLRKPRVVEPAIDIDVENSFFALKDGVDPPKIANADRAIAPVFALTVVFPFEYARIGKLNPSLTESVVPVNIWYFTCATKRGFTVKIEPHGIVVVATRSVYPA